MLNRTIAKSRQISTWKSPTNFIMPSDFNTMEVPNTLTWKSPTNFITPSDFNTMEVPSILTWKSPTNFITPSNFNTMEVPSTLTWKSPTNFITPSDFNTMEVPSTLCWDECKENNRIQCTLFSACSKMSLVLAGVLYRNIMIHLKSFYYMTV